MTTSVEPSAASSPTDRRLPDFFIVGHPKCGTTALYEMLRAHPQIFMPELKETRYFAPELHPRLDPGNPHPETFEEYVALFAEAAPEQCAGEASPSYLRSQTAAARIAELRPDARIIAILREPASFLRSLHLELVQDHVEPEHDLGRAIALEQARREDPEHPGLVYPEYVQYVEQLRRYHAVFPPEQVLILIYDDFRADNEATVRRVLRFLAVDERSPVAVTEANPSVRVRSLGLYTRVRSLYLGESATAASLKRAIKALTPQRMRRSALDAFRRRVLYGKPLPADEQLMHELRLRFEGEVIALSEYLDRDLVALWGYDDIR
jgi:hypothetical protein